MDVFKLPIVEDDRVVSMMDACPDCDAPLREIITADKSYMLRTAQCPACLRVYLTDEVIG